MTDKESDANTYPHALISFPMLAKYAGMGSVRDIQFERLVLKMKPDCQTTDSDEVVRKMLESQGEDFQKRVRVVKDRAQLY